LIEAPFDPQEKKKAGLPIAESVGSPAIFREAEDS
jgi:hypothetical protein